MGHLRKMSIVLAFLVASSTWMDTVRAADPDPLVDLPASGEWVLRDVFTNGVVSHGPGGVRAALNTSVFPALTSEGITYVQFKMNPCGENLPHTHPRATEILTLISGGPLQAGFVDTSGTPHIYILNPGDIIVFPKRTTALRAERGNDHGILYFRPQQPKPGNSVSRRSTSNATEPRRSGALNQDQATIAKLKSEIYAYSDSLQLDPRANCVPGRDITTSF